MRAGYHYEVGRLLYGGIEGHIMYAAGIIVFKQSGTYVDIGWYEMTNSRMVHG